MKFRLEGICVDDNGAERLHDVMDMEGDQLAMDERAGPYHDRTHGY